MYQRIAIEDNIRVDTVDYVPLSFVLGFFYCNDETEYKIVQQNSWKGPFSCLSGDMVLSI